MSFSAPRLLRPLVCACVIGVVELPAAPQPSALPQSNTITIAGGGPVSTVYTGYRQHPMRSR